ncbi:MAG: LytR C-terminal domain-containing protein [Acidimicrobiia bacterium]
MARHAAPGVSGFLRELGMFTAKVLFWAVIVFGGVVLLTKGIGWLATSSTTTGAAAVSTTSLVAGASGTAPTTTVPTTTALTTTAATAASTTTTEPVRAPADITVQVLNSTTRDQIAAALTDVLVSAGYQTIDADNYSHALDQSTVWYAPGFESEARVIANAYIPDAVVQESPGPLDVDIVVVIGASYQE